MGNAGGLPFFWLPQPAADGVTETVGPRGGWVKNRPGPPPPPPTGNVICSDPLTDACTHWVLKPKVQHPSNVVRAERGQQSARTMWD